MFDDLRAAAQKAHDEQAGIQPQEAPEVVEEVATAPAQTEHEKYQERNFRELREAKERLQRERDEAYALVQQLANHKQQQAPVEEQDVDIDLNTYPELQPLDRKIKKLENQLKQYQQNSSTANAEVRLKAQYPDFDKVVSKANVELFAAMHPEMARTIDSSPDLYAKAVTAYNMIKQFGVYKEDTFDVEKKLAATNAAKPKPLASISAQMGDTPLSRANAFANGLTKELKASLWAEMEASKKRV